MTFMIAVLMFIGIIQPSTQAIQFNTLTTMIGNNQQGISQALNQTQNQQVINEVFVPKAAKVDIIDGNSGN